MIMARSVKLTSALLLGNICILSPEKVLFRRGRVQATLRVERLSTGTQEEKICKGNPGPCDQRSESEFIRRLAGVLSGLRKVRWHLSGA